LFMPISGEVVAVNSTLTDAPDTVNSDPYGEGWMVKVKMSDPSQLDGLLSAEDYKSEIGA